MHLRRHARRAVPAVDDPAKARIAHGTINGDTLLADPAAQAIVLADFRNTSASAPPDRLDHDTADALAATAIAVGAE